LEEEIAEVEPVKEEVKIALPPIFFRPETPKVDIPDNQPVE